MKKSVLKIPIILIVLYLSLIFILAACQKQEPIGHREHRFGMQSNYVTLGKSMEGDNFYCIHMNKREGYFDDVKAIPAVYIIDVDLTGAATKILYSVPGEKRIEQNDLTTFTLGIYNVETGKLIKTIDAKGLMEQKFPNAQPRVGTNIDTLVYKGAPCLTLVVEDRPETIEQGMIDTERRLCFNLDTEEVTEIEKEREGRSFPMDRELDILVNNRSIFEANHLGESTLWYSFQNLDYWAGACHVDVAVEELPQEDVELYHMFPDLREKAEEIKAKGGEPWVDIYLTDKKTTEEILRVFIPENQKIVFDGVFITSDRSKDGKEHAVSSFEEYDKYLKPYYEDPTGVSPIFTFVK